jgi:homogentisate 1,2-dioxygenase
MSGLTKFSVSEIAASLDQPFSIADVAYVDDILVGIYACEGEIQRHRHVDIDELFWVYEGAIELESERGDVRLESEELAVVPKGTRHRSRSGDRATVILLRCGFLPDRKNGKRRLYAVDDDGLPCLNIRDEAEKLVAPFHFRTITQVEDSMVQIGRGNGRWPVELPVAHDRMFYVVDGALTVRTVRNRLHLGPGDFTVVPRGAFYHLYTADETLLVRVTRGAL